MSTISEIDSFLRQFSCITVLREVAQISKILSQEKCIFQEAFTIRNNVHLSIKITQWGLAFLAHRAILVSNDGRSKVFTYDDLCYASWLHAELQEPFLDDGNIFSFLGRISQEQFTWQEKSTYKFSRNYLLLIELPKKIKNKNLYSELQISFEEVFFENFGITIKNFLTIAFTIYGRSLINPLMRLDKLNEHNIEQLSSVLTSENIKKFLLMSVGDYNQIRELSRDINRLSLLGYEKYDFNPLFKFPIIKGDARYRYYKDFQLIVPNTELLVNKFTNGVYWELREIYRKLNSREFLKSFGLVFEAYVGELLMKYFSSEQVQYLEPIQGRNNNKIADWAVFLDNTILIFECKSSLLPFITKQTYNEKSIEEWGRDTFLKGIRQLNNSEKIILEDTDNRNKAVYKFLVTYENLYIAETPMFKDFLQSKLKSITDHDSSFYIVPIQELEFLQKPILNLGIENIIMEKQRRDINPEISNGYSFIDASKRLGSTVFENSWLKETFDKYFQSLV